MGQRGGECVGCKAEDIEELKELSEYLHDFKCGAAGKYGFPAPSPDNKIVSIIKYLGECPFPVTMQRIHKHSSPNAKNRKIYETTPAVKYAVLLEAVKIVYGSKINKYQLTKYGRSLADLIMFEMVGLPPFTSYQQAPCPVSEESLPVPSLPRQRAPA